MVPALQQHRSSSAIHMALPSRSDQRGRDGSDVVLAVAMAMVRDGGNRVNRSVFNHTHRRRASLQAPPGIRLGLGP